MSGIQQPYGLLQRQQTRRTSDLAVNDAGSAQGFMKVNPQCYPQRSRMKGSDVYSLQFTHA